METFFFSDLLLLSEIKVCRSYCYLSKQPHTNNSVIFVGSVCDENIDDCLINSDGSVPCNGRGVCVDGVNSYDCLCQPGWVGADCQLLVNDCVGTYSYLPASSVCI